MNISDLGQITFFIVLIIILGHPVTLRAAEDWQALEKKINQLTSESLSESQETRRLLNQDQRSLEKTLQELKQKVQKSKTSLDNSKQEFAGLKEEEKKHREVLKEEKEEIKQIQGTVLSAVKDLDKLLEETPLGTEFVEAKNRIDQMKKTEYFPGMEDIRFLVTTYFQYIKESGQIKKFEGKYINAKGKEAFGQIVRIGALTALYKNQGQVGFLRPIPGRNHLRAVPGKPSWFELRAIKNFIKGEKNHIPLDISGGAVFKRLSRDKSIGEWIQAGGPLVWPIFFIGFLALVLGLERFLFFLRIRSNSDRIMINITQMARNDNWEKCREFCKQNKNYPTCQVLKSALDHLGTTQQALENALNEAMLRQLPKLERFLSTLSLLAAIAPLLGLLGTVTGMINTFQVITIFGTGDPKHMAGGISQALITTQLGLAVAIPIMFLHHLLERRTDKILGDIEEKGAAFTLTLLEKGQIVPKDDQNE